MAEEWLTWEEIRPTLNVNEARVAQHKARMLAEQWSTLEEIEALRPVDEDDTYNDMREGGAPAE